jgi:outer membrane protein, multidrug efflux system
MRLKLFAASGVLLLFSGCAVHSPQETPLPFDPPATFTEPANAVEAVAGRWWESFADVRLNEVMEEALAANLDLEQAYARLAQAEALLRTSAAAERPLLNVDGAGGRGRQSTPFGAGTADTFRLSAAASYEIDLWRRLASRTEAAQLDALAARQEVKALTLTLSALVADLYYLAAEQRQQLALSDNSIAAFTDTLERVELRYREGLVPAIDVYQSRQNLAAAKARRPQFENALIAAENALAVLLGRYPQAQTAGEPAQIPSAGAPFAAGVPGELLARRPDVDAALMRLQASDARIGAAIAERFPALRLTGSYGGASAELGDLLSSGSIFWNLLLNIAQPILDGGRREAEVERSRALFRENLARYHQSVLNAFREVEDALAANRTSEERLLHLEDREEASAAALRLALDRYLQGLSDYLPVLTAQGLHFDAQSQLLTARRQLVADRITLARALGGEWMDEEMAKRR